MLFNHRALKVFIYQEPIDMRSGYERLSYFVREQMRHDILAGHIFLFLGKNRRRVKALLFDGTGLILISKRLEQGRFMRVESLVGIDEISVSEMGLLLDGADIRQARAPRREARLIAK